MEIEHLRRSRELERSISSGDSAAAPSHEHRFSVMRRSISEIRSGIGPVSGFVPRRRSIMRIRWTGINNKAKTIAKRNGRTLKRSGRLR